MIQRASSRLAKFETNSSYQYGFLAAITLLAIVLRFYKLGEWSFWIDEIFTVRRVQAHINVETIIDQWWQPSLSLILTGGVLHVLGVSEWSARLVSAVIGIISIPVLYFPIKRLFGPGVGLVAAVLLAVSPWHLYWSQNARFCTSLMLLYSLAFFAFFFGIERDRPRYILVFLLLLFLAQGERLIALLLVPVVVCYLLLLKIMPFEKPPGLRPRNLLLILLPGIVVGIHQVYSLVATGWFYLSHAIDVFVGKPIDDPFRLLAFIGFNIGIPLMSLAFFGGIYLLLEKSRAGLFVFTSALVPLLLLVIVSPFIFAKDRYVFITLPSWIILAAIAVKETLSHFRERGIVLAIGVLVLLLADAGGANLLYYQINRGNRRDWKGAFALIQERRAENDIIVSTRPELGTYYLGQEVRWMGDITPDVAAKSGERIWFVTDSESVWVTGEIRMWVEENCELIDVRALRVPEDISLRVYLCDPRYNIAPETD